MQYPDIDATVLRWSKRSYVDVWQELAGYRRAGRPLLVVGIDGHSGSGKTTLARGLAALDGATAVVHTDDLAWHHSFFGWGQLLIDHVLVPLQRGQTPISYRPPGWVARGRPGSVSIPAGATAVLVEGVGACQREVRSFLGERHGILVYASPDAARR